MDLQELGRTNRRQILRHILMTGGASRTEIAAHTGLAKSSITAITERLVSLGILRETTLKRKGNRGRPPVHLTFRPGNCLVVVAKPDAVAARAYLVAADGTVVDTRSEQLSAAASAPAMLAAVERCVSLVAQGRWRSVHAVTVIGPGVIDTATGALLISGTGSWQGTNLQAPLRGLPRQVLLQNGSRLRALAENWYGAARDVDDFVYFHLDSGIGGAVVLGGTLMDGPAYGAGEFGHMPLSAKEGAPCQCGLRSCVESVAAMPAIVRGIGNGCATFADAWARYRQDDPEARQVFEPAVQTLARAVLSVAVALGPNTVLLGGRMVDQTDGAIVTLIRDRIGRSGSFRCNLDVRRCALRDEEAELLGAVAYALQETDYESRPVNSETN